MAKANNMTPVNNHRLRLTDIIKSHPREEKPGEKNAPLQTFAVARGNTLTAAAKNLKDSTLKGCKGFPQLLADADKGACPKATTYSATSGFLPFGLQRSTCVKIKAALNEATARGFEEVWKLSFCLMLRLLAKRLRVGSPN
jgi:hypothetical protein